MFRIKCLDKNNKWRVGKIIYATLNEAKTRELELNKVGIKTVIVKA